MKQQHFATPDPRRPYALMLTMLAVLWVVPQLMAFSGAWNNISSQQLLDTAWLNTSFTLMKALMALALVVFTLMVLRPQIKGLYTVGAVLAVLSAALQAGFIFFRVRQGDVAQQLTVLELLQYILQLLLILSLPLIFQRNVRLWAASAGMLLSGMYVVMLLGMMVVFHQSVAAVGYQYFAGQVEWVMMLPVSIAAFGMGTTNKRHAQKDAAANIEAYIESLPEEAADTPSVTE